MKTIYYEMTADALKNRAKEITLSTASYQEKWYALFELKELMYDFADIYKAENSRFDEIKFVEACNLEKYYFSFLIYGNIRFISR